MLSNEHYDNSAPPVTYLYVHVPFCPSKCPYCAFVTRVGSLRLMEPYLTAVLAEAETLIRRRPGGPLRTVYFGGGTPSMMTATQVGAILDRLEALCGLGAGCEVTLEAHPATVDLNTLHRFRSSGVTRLSFGGESLNQAELTRLGRGHSGERVVELVELGQRARFESINVDLMYGIPGQTIDTWGSTLCRALEAAPDHLSLYPLQIESRTVYGRDWERNRLTVPEDEAVTEMYHLACRLLAARGYEHYEVANWALPGHHCRHNLAYWHNEEFFAIGVGAHGYLKPYRTENVPQTTRYIRMLREGALPRAHAVFVDATAELNETVMLRLRLLGDGLDLEEIRRRFGIDLGDRFAPAMEELSAHDLLHVENGRITLTETAVPLANEVWERFMI